MSNIVSPLLVPSYVCMNVPAKEAMKQHNHILTVVLDMSNFQSLTIIHTAKTNATRNPIPIKKTDVPLVC